MENANVFAHNATLKCNPETHRTHLRVEQSAMMTVIRTQPIPTVQPDRTADV
jgi:hypothetical protein